MEESKDKVLPGTAATYIVHGEKGFEKIEMLLEATGGLSLSQVCAVTGLEGTTIQNWVKRGWVAHPKGKKYEEIHIARVLIINALKDCIKLEHVSQLMTYVNGNAASDAVIKEKDLFNYLCDALQKLGQVDDLSRGGVDSVVDVVISEYDNTDPYARAKIHKALAVMIYACVCTDVKRRTEAMMEQVLHEIEDPESILVPFGGGGLATSMSGGAAAADVAAAAGDADAVASAGNASDGGAAVAGGSGAAASAGNAGSGSTGAEALFAAQRKLLQPLQSQQQSQQQQQPGKAAQTAAAGAQMTAGAQTAAATAQTAVAAQTAASAQTTTGAQGDAEKSAAAPEPRKTIAQALREWDLKPAETIVDDENAAAEQEADGAAQLNSTERTVDDASHDENAEKPAQKPWYFRRN
ncbi:MAG: DUF1836 domain-containing protein [Oscillospiraceae bacterium]|nr:DUF1836 domain-containing protein [Oscillospiraceae bacterium]